MKSIYTDRINHFLSYIENAILIPIEYIVRVDEDGELLPIVNDDKPIIWTDMPTYMSRYLDLDIPTLESISEQTNIIPSELVRIYIDVDMEEFLNKTYARQLLDIIDPQSALNIDVLARKINPWREDYELTAKNEFMVYSKYPIMIDTLNSLNISQSLTESTIVSENLTYPFVTDKSPVELFDQSTPSIYVPYICINNGGEMFYKIFDNPGLGLTKEYYSNIIDRSRKIDTNNTLMLLVWRKGEDFKNPTKDSLIQVFIYDNKVHIRFDNKGNIEDIIGEIQRSILVALPTKILGSSNFSYKIVGAKYNKYIFQIQLTTNPVLRSFIIMNESNTAGSSKRSQMYQFINMGLNLPIRGETPSMSIRQDDNGEVIVTLSDVKDKELEYYKTLSSKLIAISIMDSKYIVELFGTFPWIGEVKKTKEPRASHLSGPLGELKRIAGDIFVSLYSRKCQGNDQPTLIKDEDIEDYKRQTFEFKGKTYNRQVMPFPEVNPKLHLICTRDPEKPFPGLLINNLDNKGDFPFMPCCYKTNNFDERTQTYKKKNREKTSKNDLITNKILRSGKMGTLPYRVGELLSDIIPGSYKRLGTVLGPKSIIHSFVYAIDEEYRKAVLTSNKELIDAKEKQYVDLFNYVLNKPELGTGIVRQEMYDYTDEQIKGYINGEHYDYEYIYRMFEEFIGNGFNIFSFTNSLNKDTTTGLPGDLIIPRYKLYSYRVHRPELPTIILFKTWGAEGDNLTYPQYELVVGEFDNEIQTVFGPDMTEGLLDYMNQVHDIRVLDQGTTIPDINYEKYFVQNGYVIISQFIDTYGKLRAIRLEKDKKRIDILTIPSQPMKYPRFYDITRHSYDTVTSILGKPNNDTDTNIWYNIDDYKNAFTVPISGSIPKYILTSDANGLDLSIFIEEDIKSGTLGSTDRLVKLSKISLVILQIIEWLYNRYDTTFLEQGNYDVDELDYVIDAFFRDAIYYSEQEVDTLYVYNIQQLPYQLPTNIDFHEAMKLLSTVMPQAILDNKLLIYGREMASDIMYFLSRYLRYARQVQRDNNGKITTRYRTIYDFTPKSNCIIFSDMDDIESWIKKITNQESKIAIDDRLIAWNSISEDPELLEYNGIVYIIQNVADNSVNNCYTLELRWRMDKINLGYIREPSDITDIKIEVYHLEPDNRIVYVGLLQDGTRDTIKVLEFTRGRFAAMLKMD